MTCFIYRYIRYNHHSNIISRRKIGVDIKKIFALKFPLIIAFSYLFEFLIKICFIYNHI